eukprot:1759578-Rhodomonas_salina.2
MPLHCPQYRPTRCPVLSSATSRCSVRSAKTLTVQTRPALLRPSYAVSGTDRAMLLLPVIVWDFEEKKLLYRMQ